MEEGSPTAVRPQVVCIGSAALDVVLAVDAAPADDDRTAATAGRLAGGGPAATAAVTLSRLGVPVAFVGRVGEDAAGAFIRADLAREGVDVSLLDTAQRGASALSTCLVKADGTRALAAFGGVNSRPWRLTRAIESVCRSATWIHVDHAGWPLAVRLHRRGVRTLLSVDGGNPIAELDLRIVTLYAPSRRELCRWTARPDAADAMRAAYDAGAPLVVATDGPGGSAALSALPARTPHVGDVLRRAGVGPFTREPHHIAQRAFPAAGSSTLGAGDVYHGALLAALLDGRALDDAMAFAAAAAAIACRGLDGRSGIPTWDEVEGSLRTARPAPQRA